MDLSNSIVLFRDLFVISILLAIFIQDFKRYIIPDKLIYPSIGIVLAINLFLGEQITNLLLATLVASGFFYAQYFFSNGRWIGFGDVKLGVLMGVILGFPNALVALFLSYILGSIVAIFLLITKKREIGGRLPFGTFLVVSTIITMFYGELLLNWYLNLYIL